MLQSFVIPQLKHGLWREIFFNKMAPHCIIPAVLVREFLCVKLRGGTIGSKFLNDSIVNIDQDTAPLTFNCVALSNKKCQLR